MKNDSAKFSKFKIKEQYHNFLSLENVKFECKYYKNYFTRYWQYNL